MSIVVDTDSSFAAQIARRLQLAFDARRITPSVVADELGISSPAVRKWLRTGKVRLENVIEFCDLYAVNLEWLLTGMGTVEAEAVTSKGGSGVATRYLPVLPLRADSLSGKGDLDYTLSEKVIPWSVSGGDASTAFRVVDDSLSGRYSPGSLLICSFEEEAVVGDLVVGKIARKNGHKEMVARYKVEPRLGDIQYVSGDPRYPSVSPDDLEVIGVVVEARIPLH